MGFARRVRRAGTIGFGNRKSGPLLLGRCIGRVIQEPTAITACSTTTRALEDAAIRPQAESDPPLSLCFRVGRFSAPLRPIHCLNCSERIGAVNTSTSDFEQACASHPKDDGESVFQSRQRRYRIHSRFRRIANRRTIQTSLCNACVCLGVYRVLSQAKEKR